MRIRDSASTDPARRIELMKQAEALALSANVVVPLTHNTRRRLVDPRVKGWVPNPLDFNLSQYLEVTP